MATVYQRCKSDKRNVNYPCTKPRCGHPRTVRYREPAGAERQPSFEKKSQADAFADRLQHDKYEGLYLDPKRGEVTLRAYAAEWLERQVISDSTYRNYESFLRIHLLPHLGGKTIVDVEQKDIGSVHVEEQRFSVSSGGATAADLDQQRTAARDRPEALTGTRPTAARRRNWQMRWLRGQEHGRNRAVAGRTAVSTTASRTRRQRHSGTAGASHGHRQLLS
ncbi:hypothetical protein ACFXO2_00960 [Streptomyces sp. NPDC059152]|uniref:hypothetical protein n=1 Tax=Streptomyces sp. NPDC059152 TaxID=3346742 RepID=UPI0036987234